MAFWSTLPSSAAMILACTTGNKQECIQCSKASEQNFWKSLNYIVKPFYFLFTHVNDINHRYLDVNSLRCEFQLLYILSILKKHHCDVTDVMSQICTMTPKNHQVARISHIRTKYQLEVRSKRLRRQCSKFSYNWFFSEPTHNFLDHPSNQEASPEGQTALYSLSNMHPIKRNYKTSHSAPRTDKRRLTKTAAILFSKPRIVVNDIMKRTPTHETSLKWVKVTVSTQKRSHTFQEASCSKKSTRNKTLTSRSYLSSKSS